MSAISYYTERENDEGSHRPNFAKSRLFMTPAPAILCRAIIFGFN